MYTEQQNKKAVERALETVSVRSVTTLAQTKPHILKSKGGAWHVAAMSMVPLKLVKAAVEYRNNFLERETMKRWSSAEIVAMMLGEESQ